MRQVDQCSELPFGLVIFSGDGTAQFGWQDPSTGDYYAEVDGRCIQDAIGCVIWLADVAH